MNRRSFFSLLYRALCLRCLYLTDAAEMLLYGGADVLLTLESRLEARL